MEQADELPAAPDAQFVMDIRDVVFDRVDGDEELLLDLGVAFATEDELDDA